MIKLVNLLLVVTGIVFVVAGIALAQKNADYWLLSVLGVGMAVLGFVLDQRRAKRLEGQRKNRSEQRTRELTAASWEANRKLAVRGSSGIPLLILMTLVGASATYAGITDPKAHPMLLLGGILGLSVFLFALLRALAGVGKPLLELSAQGVRLPIHGFIPWREVGGIALSRHSHRGMVIYTLMFQVENYRRAVCVGWALPTEQCLDDRCMVGGAHPTY